MTPLNGRHAEDRVDLDQVFGALCHATRRRILTTLLKDDRCRQQEFEAVGVGPDDVAGEADLIELQHSHLPRLADAEFVDWDRETGSIARGKRFAEIRPVLELMDDHREELPDGWP